MPTVRAALEAAEASLFVDRQGELEEFTRWLTTDTAQSVILQVTGHAGVGKSALLRMFARTAESLGRRPIVIVDGEAISPTPSEFITALTGDADADPVTFLGDGPALLIIDGMEELAPLTRWLTARLIPALSESVRVVIGGRQPVGPMWRRWHKAMRTIRLESLSRDAAAAYLERRGVTGEVAGSILEAAGGYPLGLTLAADLVVQRHVTRFEKAPEWHLTLRSLVNEFVKDAPDVRSLLEAAAVVRQFDEPTLAAVTGLTDPGRAFAALCAVSFVRPAQHGLTLHEDVRRVVIEELQWRNPGRLADLRRGARAFYRDRIRERRPGQEWLVSERIYLWEHSIHVTYFPTGDPSTLWLESGGTDDLDDMLSIQAEWVAMLQAGIPLPVMPPPEECSPEFLGAVASLPGTEITVARSPDGLAHGYVFFFPVTQASLAILPPDGAIATVIERGLPDRVRRALPSSGTESEVMYMSTIVARGERALEAGGALAADSYRMALRGGIFLACTGDDTYAMSLVAMGGAKVPGVGTSAVGTPRPLDGYVVDIGHLGPDAWLEAVTSGRPLPPVLSEEELEKELHEVLVAWPDDARLAESPLAKLAALIASADEAVSPEESLRAVIRRVLTDVPAEGNDEVQLACRALELAYLDRKVGHEQIAERLNVSRSSFYRLLHRAEREIANRLTAATRS